MVADWKINLAREIRKAGIEIDLNRVDEPA
jgi:hypothetical protein